MRVKRAMERYKDRPSKAGIQEGNGGGQGSLQGASSEPKKHLSSQQIGSREPPTKMRPENRGVNMGRSLILRETSRDIIERKESPNPKMSGRASGEILKKRAFRRTKYRSVRKEGLNIAVALKKEELTTSGR